MARTDLSDGYDPQLDYPLSARPGEPDMRESMSMWFFDDQGRVGFPRFCIEALASQWENRGVLANIAFADGKVLRCMGGFAALEPKRASGRNISLGAGPLRFEVVEPLRRWLLVFDGEANETSAIRQIAAVPPGRSRRVRLHLDAVMAVPPWSTGEQASAAAASAIGAVSGHRNEQLFRCSGSLQIDDDLALDFSGTGLKVRRFGLRDVGDGFPGHCWQSALFPSGRAFGSIALAPYPGQTTGFSEGFVYDGRRKRPAKVVEAPWMTELPPFGGRVDLVLDTEDGRESIEGVSCLSTAYAPNASLFGGWTENGQPRRLGPLPVQQAGAIYRWQGETAYGMVERSFPAEITTGLRPAMGR